MVNKYAIFNSGYLDSSSNEADLKTGTKLDLPVWLVKSVYNEKFKFVSIEIPKVYKHVYHEILQADPNVVDLRKLGPYYFDFGVLLVQFEHVISQDIAKLLLWVFKNRFRRTMELSNQTDHRDLVKAIGKLDVTEMDIYKAGQHDALQFIKWQRREFCKLLPSVIVTANKNKRKRRIFNKYTKNRYFFYYF